MVFSLIEQEINYLINIFHQLRASLPSSQLSHLPIRMIFDNLIIPFYFLFCFVQSSTIISISSDADATVDANNDDDPDADADISLVLSSEKNMYSPLSFINEDDHDHDDPHGDVSSNCSNKFSVSTENIATIAADEEEECCQCLICHDKAVSLTLPIPRMPFSSKRALRTSDLITSFVRANSFSRHFKSNFLKEKKMSFQGKGHILIERNCGNLFHEGCLVQMALISKEAPIRCPLCRTESPVFMGLEECIFKMPPNLIRNVLQNYSDFSNEFFKYLLKWLKYYHFSDRLRTEDEWWTILNYLIEAFSFVDDDNVFDYNYSTILESISLLSSISNVDDVVVVDDVLLKFMKSLKFSKKRILNQFFSDFILLQGDYRRILDLILIIKNNIFDILSDSCEFGSPSTIILEHMCNLHMGKTVPLPLKKREINLFFEIDFLDSSLSLFNVIVQKFPNSSIIFVETVGKYQKMISSLREFNQGNIKLYSKGDNLPFKAVLIKSLNKTFKDLKSLSSLTSLLDDGINLDLLVKQSLIDGKGMIKRLDSILKGSHYKF